VAGQKRLKVFLDSNVFFAALYMDMKGSYPSIILRLAQEHCFDLYFSTLVELEVKHNIAKKLPQKRFQVDSLFKNFKKLEDVSLELSLLKRLSEKDRIIISTAIYHRMNYFVTGNTKDFSYLLGKKIDQTFVLAPKNFCLREFADN